ncbi:MAG TPA: Na/Pi cotransporter family protein [Rhodobacteraceae bacterium]|nr:Na/Pi cotransporter family protein [Paracoccaceae bacterium]
MLSFLLNLAGAAALLLWSVRIIRTGFQRAFKSELRTWLRRSSDNPALAAGTGVFAAVLLQSSTAVALLVSNFATKGTIAVAVGLAIFLGADLGSAIVTQILLVRAAWLVPLLLLVGVTLFLKGQQPRVRQSGRILIGLALVLVSLDMIRLATEPIRDSAAIEPFTGYLARDVFSAFIVGALLAWAMHSSVAAVLMFVTFTAHGLLPATAAMAMVLGANLGGSFIPFTLTLGAPVSARTIVLGNLLLRGGGAVFALLLLANNAFPASYLGTSEARQVINLHLVYNLAILLVGLPLIRPLTGFLGNMLAEPANGSEPARIERISALDEAALQDPERALSSAAREVLHIGETIEAMLSPVMQLYETWDDAIADAIRENESSVNKMHFETKLYLAKLHQQGLSEKTASESMELSSVAINLEAAGDVISKNLLNMAKKVHDKKLQFSREGWQELCDFHDRVLSNVQLSLNVLMTKSVDSARQLVEEKEKVREVEQDLQQRHLERLRKGTIESIETSNIHQETLRALKQINTAVSMVAYSILRDTGELLPSRLADSNEEHD